MSERLEEQINGGGVMQAVIDGMRTRPVMNGWLKKRAISHLNLDEDKLRSVKRSDLRNVKHYTRKSTFMDITPEERWLMAYTLRSARNDSFKNELKREICEAAYVDPRGVDIITVTRESMFPNAVMDDSYATSRFDGWEDYVQPGFTGDITVIIDMEDSTRDDVSKMISWLKTVGAWKLFSTVEGPTASYAVHEHRATKIGYPSPGDFARGLNAQGASASTDGKPLAVTQQS